MVRSDGAGPRAQGLTAGASRGGRVARCARPWAVAVLAAALTVGVTVAATDPDWFGSEPEEISFSPGPVDRAWQPAVAAGASGRIVIVWTDERTPEGERDVYAALSDNGGWTWSPPQVISATVGESQLPDVVVVGDRAFVTWSDRAADQTFRTFEAERDPESGTWTSRYVPGSLSYASTRSALVAGPARMHLLFHGGSDPASEAWPSILHAARWLTETTWPAAQVIVTRTAGVGLWYPAMAVSPDGAQAHLVWEEQVSSGVGAIKYMSGTVTGGGVHWSRPPILLSTGVTKSVWPSVATDSSGDVHVVWGEIVGPPSDSEQYVRYARYSAASDRWGPGVRIDREPVRVNATVPFKIAPGLASYERGDQHTLCVAWYGYRAGAAEAEEVLLSCSQDGGTSWTSPENVSRSPQAEEISILQSIALDEAGGLHAAWQERVEVDPEAYEIMYARSPDKVFLPSTTRDWYVPKRTFLPFVGRSWRHFPNRVLLPLVGRSWRRPPDGVYLPLAMRGL